MLKTQGWRVFLHQRWLWASVAIERNETGGLVCRFSFLINLNINWSLSSRIEE
jgi:hypothetical protein